MAWKITDTYQEGDLIVVILNNNGAVFTKKFIAKTFDVQQLVNSIKAVDNVGMISPAISPSPIANLVNKTYNPSKELFE